METTRIREEYVNRKLIPRDCKAADGFARSYELHRFRVIEIAPELFDSLFDDPAEADALTVCRRRYLTRAERDEIKAQTGRTRLFDTNALYRVIAYKGQPIKTAEYPDVSAALRDAVAQREHPAQDTDKNV